jgi:molecular chaperone Hsp33
VTFTDSRDFSQKFLFQDRPIRGQIVRLTETYDRILSGKNYPPNIRRFLGEALACTALIHGLFKNTGKISLQFQGTGDLTLLSIHGELSHLRGLVHYSKDLSPTELSLLSALQQGQLQLTFDFGENARHQSIIEVISPQMKENVEHYFAQSEQTKTYLSLAVSPVSVTGYLMQQLPSKDPDAEEAWNDAVIRASTLSDEELLMLPIQTLLGRLYPEDTLELFSPETIQFHCPCTKNRMEKALVFMGRAEVTAILEKEEHVDVTCEFCGRSHAFDSIDIEKVFRDAE